MAGYFGRYARRRPRQQNDPPKRAVLMVPDHPPSMTCMDGGACPYFCFQLPPDSYHQPGRALLIHWRANTSRIWLSHSG